MKVYVLLGWTDYEGGDILSVHKTLKGARARKKNTKILVYDSIKLESWTVED